MGGIFNFDLQKFRKNKKGIILDELYHRFVLNPSTVWEKQSLKFSPRTKRGNLSFGCLTCEIEVIFTNSSKEFKLKQAYKIFVEHKDWNKAVACAVNLYEADKKNNYGYITGIRSRIQRIGKRMNPTDFKNLLYRTYIATARDKFDDFMIALEWNRPMEQKFWLPRRAKLLPVCNALQQLEDDELDELILSTPPRVGKTTLMLFFVLWIMFRNSERSNLYCSYSDTVVSVFYSGLLEILGDEDNYNWRDIFPGSTIASTNAKDRLINLDRMKRYASFTGRSLYGTLNGACDCNGYEIADDLISGIEEAMNKDRLQSAWSKVENNYLPRGKDKTKHLWIGTRWSLTDPTGMRLDLLENDEKFKNVRWKVINVPALNGADESNFDYACGVGFSTELYHQRRASFERNNDMASWLAQYQGEPIERDGAVFEPDGMRYFNGMLPTNVTPDRIFMAVDPAWGGGDFVASPVCYQIGDDVFVADVVFDDSDKSKTQPRLAHKAKAHKVQAMQIEGTKMTASYAEGVDEALKKLDYRCNVQTSISHYTGLGKESRIFDCAPDIREHFVFLEAGKRSKEYSLFMNQVFSFSVNGKNKHDDAPDSLAMASKMVFRSSQKAQIINRNSLGF